MNADQQPQPQLLRAPPPVPPPQSQLESLPSSVATLTLLPFAESSELLLFRAVCQTAYAFVHGHRLTLRADNSTAAVAAGGDAGDAGDGMASADATANTITSEADEPTSEEEANILWRMALSLDFGFMSEKEEKELEQYGAEAEFARTSAEYGELVVARRKYRRMFLHTFRYRPSRTSDNDASTERSFLETGEVFTAPTPFASWKHWTKLHKQFQECAARADATTGSSSGLYGPYYLRAAALWRKIENWCDQQGSFGLRMKSTFVPGRALDVASLIDDDDDDPEDPMDFIYSTLQAIWSFYGGQTRPFNASFSGLLGGYCAYDLLCCTRLIGIDEIIAQRCRMDQGFGGTLMPFAHNITGRTEKVIAVVRHLGRAFVTVANRHTRVMPCDAIEWLDTYATRLEQGVYDVGELVPSQQAPFDTRSILLYPTVADTTGRTSRAVTKGIEVVASGVDAVERQGMFIYSIRIRILTPGEDGYMSPSERGFTTCQLRSRHWIITQDTGDEPEHVRGDGVVGMYPLLKERGYDLYEGRTAATAQEFETDCEGKFAYQSATEASEAGTLGGTLQFVPGSLANPTGKEFDVQVAPFPLGEERIVF